MSLRLGEDIVMPQRVDVVDVKLLEAVAEELAAGKIQIAKAINNVGGEASGEESLSELANDIKTMPIVNISAFKFSEVPNLAKWLADSSTTKYLLVEIDDVNGEITSVGDNAFQYCTNLESVYLPNCTSIGSYAFFGALKFCKKLYIPKATVIGNYALAASIRGNSQLEELYLDSMATHPNVFMFGGNYYYYIFISLKLLSLKEDFDSDINACAGLWTASTYLVNSADQWENRLILYTNLLEYTLKRLYDHSQDGVTRTFRLGFYNTLASDAELTTEPYGSYYTPLIKAKAQECLDYMNSINWQFSA